MKSEAIELLQKIGFSRNEALVYVTLLEYGPLPARTLSELSGVPYTKTYSILESLSRKGFVTVLESRPRLYAAVDPENSIPTYVKTLIDEIKSVEEKLLKELKEIYKSGEKLEERSVLVIRDPSIIASKIAESIAEAKSYVKLSGPKRLIDRLKSELEEAVKRGVEVLIISSDKPDVQGVKRKQMKMLGGGIIVDGREVLILMREADSFIALYSNHPSLAVLAETYYDTLWNQDTPSEH